MTEVLPSTTQQDVLKTNGGTQDDVNHVKPESNHVQQQVDNNTQKKNDKKKKKKRRKKKKIIHRTIIQKPQNQENVEIEYVSSTLPFDESNPHAKELERIFSHFVKPEILTNPEAHKEEEKQIEESSTEEEEEEKEEKKKLSKKKLKLLRRPTISQLKQLVDRPDVVEIHDVTAQDPLTLAYLKSYRNTVPVPRHWSQKRKYLQGKRGIEKTPFRLPDYIAATGIQEIRDAYRSREDSKKAAAKQRDRMNPKLGKLDIDYQVLHDAFFKFQTKPKLTIHGDLYYEGKEFEIKLKNCKPGKLSDALKKALGMPPGAPPPWLINMQRHGPPPSYPHLKIPGLNAPIPEGASWGYHPGGWGRPPVDEAGRPLYGDVFGKEKVKEEPKDEEAENVELWGEPTITEDFEEERPEEIEEKSEEEEEKEEEEVEEKEETAPKVELIDTISTITSGIETPESIDLRKKKEAPKVTQPPEKKQLYTELQERKARVGGGIMGTAHKYVLPGADKVKEVEASLTPEQLEKMEKGDKEILKEKFAQEREKAVKQFTQTSSEVREVYEEETRKRKRKSEKKDKKEKKKKFKF